ncbi:MAG: carbamoyl phosphate synthase small subunit [Bacteroidales bacterium]|nr:carbamoyl phosphate synthase small subunit [Bacteroidales bacterium]
MKATGKMKLVLEDGREFTGNACGAAAAAVGELVFNTSMVGYQEILSDPSYKGKIVLMTYPPMGQYGINDDDYESRAARPAALIVKECCNTPSNYRYTRTLSEELEEHGLPCVEGLDTRMLTRIIRDNGPLKAAVVDESVSKEEALRMIGECPSDSRLAAGVSCTKRWFSRTPRHSYDVVVIDCGLKHTVVEALNRRGCNVTVVPFNCQASEILAFNPDGVLVSSGPGDPHSMTEVIECVKALKGKLPLAGTGLGHNIIGLSYGVDSVKLPCGNYGGSPVRRISDGRIVTAEHCNAYCFDPESLKGSPLEPTYTIIPGGGNDGVRCEADRVISVQFYPEGGPGPGETDFFDQFINLMKK